MTTMMAVAIEGNGGGYSGGRSSDSDCRWLCGGCGAFGGDDGENG